MSMADQDQPRVDRLTKVQGMSLQERQDAISDGVIEDLDGAPDDVRAFAERATQRYLAAFSHE